MNQDAVQEPVFSEGSNDGGLGQLVPSAHSPLGVECVCDM